MWLVQKKKCSLYKEYMEYLAEENYIEKEKKIQTPSLCPFHSQCKKRSIQNT